MKLPESSKAITKVCASFRNILTMRFSSLICLDHASLMQRKRFLQKRPTKEALFTYQGKEPKVTWVSKLPEAFVPAVQKVDLKYFS